MVDDFDSFLPLSPASLHILLSLADEDRHGYAIMKEIARQSEGAYKLGAGTLYDNLQKLLSQAIVDEIQPKAGEDPRRRYYRLTSLGRRILSAEALRLEKVVRQAKLHLRARKP